MGCDIHVAVQKRVSGVWEDVEGKFTDGPAPFSWRSYSLFGFLAGVRNYSAVKPIVWPRRGLPDDFGKSDWDLLYWQDLHSHTWLSVEELVAFDYSQMTEDRRVSREIRPNVVSGSETAEPGEGEAMSYREFLGEGFFADVAELQKIGAERVVIAFDS